MPFYASKYQPSKSEQGLARKLFDTISKDYTVFIVFGRIEQLSSHWRPIFENNFPNSNVNYKILSSHFHMFRSPTRDRFTFNTSVWHSVVEVALTVIRMPAIAKKGRKKSAEKHDIFRYNAAFLKKYGPSQRIRELRTPLCKSTLTISIWLFIPTL